MNCVPRNNACGSRPRRPTRLKKRGIVLFVVMVVIVMISLAGLSFVLTMSTENKAVHLRGDELQIEQAAASGEELIKALCEQSRQDRQDAGGWYENPELFSAVVVVDDEYGDHRARFSVVSPRIEEQQVTGLRFGLENESARLNLAVLPEWEKQQEGAALSSLMNLPEMSESIASAILDWIDADETPRRFGAESPYYLSRRVPYGPRNGVPTSLEELLLVRDVSRELLFGADLNFNYTVEQEESQFAGDQSGGSLVGSRLPWASLLTVHSAERNQGFAGQVRINLNEKDLQKLHQQLNQVFEPEWTRFVIAYRQFGPRRETGFGRQTGRPPFPSRTGPSRGRESPFSRDRGDGEEAEIDFSLPGKFRFTSVLDLIGAEIIIRQTGTPGQKRPRIRFLESPLANDRAAMEEYLPKLIDHACVDAAKVIRGRINLNEAPRAVLMGVPGLDEAIVGQVIASRGTHSSHGESNRRYPTWLLTEGIVDLQQMKSLMRYLTTGGDVFRAQVVAWFDDSGLSARSEVVIDATNTPPRQLYWKDLRLLGRGFAPESLGGESRDATATLSP